MPFIHSHLYVALSAGADVSTGTFGNCIILGANATASAINAFVLGSSSSPIATGATATAISGGQTLPASGAHYILVILNGIEVRIPYFSP